MSFEWGPWVDDRKPTIGDYVQVSCHPAHQHSRAPDIDKEILVEGFVTGSSEFGFDISGSYDLLWWIKWRSRISGEEKEIKQEKKECA